MGSRLYWLGNTLNTTLNTLNTTLNKTMGIHNTKVVDEIQKRDLVRWLNLANNSCALDLGTRPNLVDKRVCYI
jgi:hypothetical protein